MTASLLKTWHLVADIGGTNARLAAMDCDEPGELRTRRYTVAQHAHFDDVLLHFLSDLDREGGWKALPAATCLAVACAVESDVLELTNSSWVIRRNECERILGGAPVALINDFAAVGYALTELHPEDWCQIGPGEPAPDRPVVVLGPGTGLGVCSVIPSGAGHIVVEGEGGHVDFAPVTAREAMVHQLLMEKFDRVSVERLLSGNGLLNIYQALARIDSRNCVHLSPQQVSLAAAGGDDALARDSLDMFFAILGSVAGNLALTLGAKGGVYIAGGIVLQMRGIAEQSALRERFEAKGRFRHYLANIPVRVVTRDDVGLVGSMKKLQQLRD